ncbi:hypothetical protein N7491_000034 [Penicillium cf. griseofulvum]|uniref:Calcineurin-like phosphoesterase domain-containing protein n=1 Tax=Penicillium cf. griseofulvum TaxID=2972120 RepID=A0A9W9JRW6_9EURO|nr:hypothetical protein N7472_004614 [Penicillium cf. griseofulvum]KAJ5442176.1 hypothetical protein N7445_005183 [Penicillium cf. griseofulvum]KAJ5450852.1 hypothetical protein N7491_000034 [Penicillium cf. griseofulvum]
MATKPTNKIFPITTFISDLSTNLIPQPPLSSENGGGGRLVIVGDVHGMRKSLEALLEKVGFVKSKGDHLILVGDLVNKGPDSPGVVDLAIKLGASAVRGNHENAVLNAAAEISASKDSILPSWDLTGIPAGPGNPEADLPGDTVRDPENPSKCSSPTTRTTALALLPHQIDWLAALPLILRVKLPEDLASPLGDTLIVVHAGLAPNTSLENQDTYAVMHMRSLIRTLGDEDRLMPSETPGEESWVMEWDRWQDSLASKTTVIFGHDAKRRLQRSRYAIGLDSACLYGHKLSALVIEASDGKVAHQVIQVDCADVPVAPTVSAK